MVIIQILSTNFIRCADIPDTGQRCIRFIGELDCKRLGPCPRRPPGTNVMSERHVAYSDSAVIVCCWDGRPPTCLSRPYGRQQGCPQSSPTHSNVRAFLLLPSRTQHVTCNNRARNVWLQRLPSLSGLRRLVLPWQTECHVLSPDNTACISVFPQNETRRSSEMLVHAHQTIRCHARNEMRYRRWYSN